MKGRKKWLTVTAVVAIAAAQALATVGVVPPVLADVLGALASALQPAA